MTTDATAHYFESVWKRDPLTGKSGVRGPLPEQNIIDWREAEPGERSYVRMPEDGCLPLFPDEVMRMESKLRAAVRTVTYARTQILQNWLAQRTGIRIYFKAGSIEQWNCSETFTRVLPARVLPYFRLDGIFRHDDIVPCGYKLASVESGVRAWTQAEGVLPLPGPGSLMPCCRVGVTAARDELLSRLICRITGGFGSHVVILIYGGR